MREVNGKVADDSVLIKDLQIKTGQGSVLAPNLSYYICRVNRDNILPV